MRLLVIAAVLGLAAPAFSSTNEYHLFPDHKYDKGGRSLKNVTCSVGEHGLLTRGYKVLKDLPTFPYLGAAPQIRGEDSKYCGSCWQFTYHTPDGTPRYINYTAIDKGDHGKDDFTISRKGYEHLTGSEKGEHKSVKIIAQRKPPSWCGLH